MIGDLTFLMNDGRIIVVSDVEDDDGYDWVDALNNIDGDEYEPDNECGWFDINRDTIVAIEWAATEDRVL